MNKCMYACLLPVFPGLNALSPFYVTQLSHSLRLGSDVPFAGS